MLDLLIRNAKVCDGAGNPWFRADVGVRGDAVVHVGPSREKAHTVIDARRFVVCPGFIDVHTHAEAIIDDPTARNLLRQGITTVISGNCGDCAWPLEDHLKAVKRARPAVNVGVLVGHGTLRRQVMGAAKRAPTRKEQAALRRLCETAMRAGALGMSTGLFYVPGAYARLPELVDLARVVAAHGGIYASHKRSAGGKIFEALREAAAIGKKAGLPVHISHLKVLHRRGRTRKDRADEVLGVFRAARDGGIDMTFDVHPYPATWTSLSAVAIPPWVSKDGALRERLRRAAVRRRIAGEVAGKIAWIGGPDRITVARFAPEPAVEGQSLARIAAARGAKAAEAAMDLIAEGDPKCIFHALRPDDVARIICDPNGMIASDAGVVPSRRGVTHPRNYGTFPRVLREYVRERGLLTLENAVRKMTSFPARTVGLHDRGVIAPGMKADLVLFDPKRIADRATFDEPHRFPTGIRAVIVNGRIAWDGRRVAPDRPGRVLRGPGC